MKIFCSRTHARLATGLRTILLTWLFQSSPAFAELYPVKGVWVAHNHDFPIGPNEVCFTVRTSGVEAVARKLISALLIFNDNKRYEVKPNLQTSSTLISAKLTGGSYWVTEFSDARRQFWYRQKITYLLTIIDPMTIEIRSNLRRARFTRCGPSGRFPI
jgi:hypothetical protein